MSQPEDTPSLFPIESIPEDKVAKAWKRKPARPKTVLDEAREFGGWTLEKLEVLELYLKMYRRVAGSGTYIDAFAGDGKVKVHGTERPGSARVAIDSSAFRQIHLIELDDSLHNRLDHLLKASYTIRRRRRIKLHPPSDCNILLPSLLSSGTIDRERPCFALLDPNSTELSWSTVEALAAFKPFDAEARQCKVEIWVLFNTHQVMQRMWPADRDRHSVNPFTRTLNRVMGGEEAWQDLYDSDASIDALMNRYAERFMSELGYRWVKPQVIKDPTTQRAQYHMIHASDHPAAFDFMRWAKSESTFAEIDQLALPYV